MVGFRSHGCYSLPEKKERKSDACDLATKHIVINKVKAEHVL